MSFKPGNEIGDYILLSHCGEGSFGMVFLAENRVTGIRVALKIIGKTGRAWERELQSVQAYALASRQSNLLQIYHVGDLPDHFYYTMDAADDAGNGDAYLPDTLANRLKCRGVLPPAEIRKIFSDLNESLHTLHDRGMLHRDIKPDNILFVNGRAVLGDIGLSTFAPHRTTVGTPGFLPPEVLAGVRDYRESDDFYALGKVIYCALTGNPAERFPEFPADRALRGCGDLIKLYHQLCAGVVPPKLIPQHPPKRRKYRRYLDIMLAAALIATLLWVGYEWYKPDLADTVSARESVISGRLKEIERLEKKCKYSAEMEKILPWAKRLDSAYGVLDDFARHNFGRMATQIGFFAQGSKDCREFFDADRSIGVELANLREIAKHPEKIRDNDILFRFRVDRLGKKIDQHKIAEANLVKKYTPKRCQEDEAWLEKFRESCDLDI